MAVRKLALLLTITVLTTGGDAIAQGGGREPSQTIRRGQPVCYDPPKRAECRRRCTTERDTCSDRAAACEARATQCVAACPPMICGH